MDKLKDNQIIDIKVCTLDKLPTDLLIELIPYLRIEDLLNLVLSYSHNEHDLYILWCKLTTHDFFFQAHLPELWSAMSETLSYKPIGIDSMGNDEMMLTRNAGSEYKWDRDHPTDIFDRKILIPQLQPIYKKFRDEILVLEKKEEIERKEAYFESNVKKDKTPLDYMIIKRYLDMKNELPLKFKERISRRIQYKFECSSLIELVLLGAVELFKLWIVDIVTPSNYKISLYWSGRSDDIYHSARDYYLTNNDGKTYTFLQWACYHGLLSVVTLLEPYYPPCNILNHDGLDDAVSEIAASHSPLRIALSRGYIDIAWLLVRKFGYHPNIRQNQLLIELIRQDRTEDVIELLKINTRYDQNVN